MEVMNPVDFKQLQLKINSLSKEYFSYSSSMKDHDFALYKPANGLLYIEEEKAAMLAPSSKNQSHSLIAWGCGEFGQHGLDQSGDVTFEMAMRKYMFGEFMLPDGEFPVTTVCGSSHTLLLTGTDQVYCWGNGTSGQLGNGSCLTTIKPTLVPLALDGKIQGMSCGARHSFIWTTNGYCYSFGNNFNAQLGYNFSKADFKENQLQPVLVELFPDMKVKEVACGARHSLFLLTTGHVMAVGCNQHGQIGNDTTQDVVIPTMVDDLNCITHVACGNIHSLASHENGSVYAWGYGKAIGKKTRHEVTPQKFTPKDIESSAVVSLAGGDCHSMVLYDCGVVFTWGNNYEGQLGVGQEVKYQNEPKAIPSHLLPRPVIQITCGETTSAAVTGKGELFMWGKNAGLIHSDKPSQYFQYIPHHIEMDGLSVTQVSCGAWHVSAIIKNSTNEMEEISQSLGSESLEAEQSALFNQKLNLTKNAGLSCEERDNIVSEDITEHNNKCRNESIDTNTSVDSLGTETEVLRVECYDDNDSQLSENSLDSCFITKYSSNAEFSKMDDECDEILTTDKQRTKDSEVMIFNQELEDCLATKADDSNLYKTEFNGVDKIVCKTNETTNTNVMDSSFGKNCKEKYEEPSFSRQHENTSQPDEVLTIDKQNDSSRNAKMFVGSYLEGKFTTTYSEKEPSFRYTSEAEDKMILRNDKRNSRNSLLRNENATTYCMSSIEFDTEEKINDDRLPSEDCRNDKQTTKNSLLWNGNATTCCMSSIKFDTEDKINDDILQSEDFRNNNIVKDNYFLRNDEDKRSKNDSLTNYNETVAWDNNSSNNDYILKNDTVKVDINENNGESQVERESNHLQHWNDLKSVQSERKYGSITEKNVSENILGLSLNSFEQNSFKESSILKRNIRLAITPLQHSTVNAALKRNKRSILASTPVQNGTMDQTARLARSTQTIDNDVLQQTVPVIDLSFGKAVGQAKQRIKPSFTTFTNVWKASTLFREKQRQQKISNGSRRGSDGVFSLENMLPNRPVRAVREIEKWSKLKEDFTQLTKDSRQIKNDSTQELRTKTDRLSKCCHHTGELLPPICSCKKNGVLVRKRDTLTDVFIDRR